MKWMMRRTLLALVSVVCVTGTTTASASTDDGEPRAACLDIVERTSYTLSEVGNRKYLDVEVKLEAPACPGGAKYVVQALQGDSPNLGGAHEPVGIREESGQGYLTFRMDVTEDVFTYTCFFSVGGVDLQEHEFWAVRAYATSRRGTDGDKTDTATFSTEGTECGDSPGAAGWS